MSESHILLVDDDRLILRSIAKVLTSADYQVEVAESAEDALAAVQRTTFDLALIDVRLPGTSGTELAKILRERIGIPILFLSGYSDQKTVETALAAGGQGFLVKPVGAAQLIPAIEAVRVRGAEWRALQSQQKGLERALQQGRMTNTAVGILMVTDMLTYTEAFDALRKRARSERRRVEDLGEELVMDLDRRNQEKAGSV